MEVGAEEAQERLGEEGKGNGGGSAGGSQYLIVTVGRGSSPTVRMCCVRHNVHCWNVEMGLLAHCHALPGMPVADIAPDPCGAVRR